MCAHDAPAIGKAGGYALLVRTQDQQAALTFTCSSSRAQVGGNFGGEIAQPDPFRPRILDAGAASSVCYRLLARLSWAGVNSGTAFRSPHL